VRVCRRFGKDSALSDADINNALIGPVDPELKVMDASTPTPSPAEAKSSSVGNLSCVWLRYTKMFTLPSLHKNVFTFLFQNTQTKKTLHTPDKPGPALSHCVFLLLAQCQAQAASPLSALKKFLTAAGSGSGSDGAADPGDEDDPSGKASLACLRMSLSLECFICVSVLWLIIDVFIIGCGVCVPVSKYIVPHRRPAAAHGRRQFAYILPDPSIYHRPPRPPPSFNATSIMFAGAAEQKRREYFVFKETLQVPPSTRVGICSASVLN
jgi:hypothetical protein